MRCSFCLKETPSGSLIEFPKGPKLCWHCIDIIQRWETYRDKINESNKTDNKKEAK